MKFKTALCALAICMLALLVWSIMNLHPSQRAEVLKLETVTIMAAIGFLFIVRRERVVCVAMFCALGGWMAFDYCTNDFWNFHMNIFGMIFLLIGVASANKKPSHLLTTTIFLLMFLPLADFFLRHNKPPEVSLNKAPYSFASAKKDPATFAAWWMEFNAQAMKLHRSIGQRSSDPLLPYELKPNSEAKFFESTIKINSLGFRGPEIAREKGGAYRIIALGESTTFGYTMAADAKPWPEVLQGLLSKPGHPVEVINAGIYGLNIAENVHRLEKLMELKPDMILSYHGYNYFPTILPTIRSARVKAPPIFIERPLMILALLEHRIRLKILEVKSKQPEKEVSRMPFIGPYLEAYSEMAGICREHGVKLAIANFSMAVNAESAKEVIDFYRAGFPEVDEVIKANQHHTEAVQITAWNHPEIIRVNTLPTMDGQHEKYIDLVHFTKEGDEAIAEAFYEAVKSQIK